MSHQILAPTMTDHDHQPISDASDVYHVDLVAEIDMALEKGQPVVMRSKLARLSVCQAVVTYKKASIICMLAAFSASLDGYRASCFCVLVLFRFYPFCASGV